MHIISTIIIIIIINIICLNVFEWELKEAKNTVCVYNSYSKND